jgi:hypothetical protein
MHADARFTTVTSNKPICTKSDQRIEVKNQHLAVKHTITYTSIHSETIDVSLSLHLQVEINQLE